MGGRRAIANNSQRGAETLELVAGLPLLGVVVTALLQGAVLVEDHARATSDARELVRHRVVCEHRDAPPATVAGDAALRSGRVTFTTAGDADGGMLVTASVVLPPRALLPGLPGGLDSPLAARASATMRQEPC
jgi:hypothetical protein